MAEAVEFSSLRFANAFASPFVTHVWQEAAECNPLLKETILSSEAASPGVTKSNQGGWHSKTGQLEFCGEAGRRLVAYVVALANEATKRVFAEFQQSPPVLEWTLSAWANVNRNGAFNKMHVHPGSTWSGTYYVDTGEVAEPNDAAVLHLWDPCPGRSTTFLRAPDSIYIRPRPGLMVLFPSYVPHMVFPHQGGGSRISIAFNLRKEPFP